MSDLATLLLVNKWLNEFFSPLLYSSGILKTFHSAQMWLRTLSAPQNDLFGARDLACFVRNLNVGDVSSMFKTDRSLEDEMRTGITEVLPRLVHLRQLCFRTPGVLTSEVLVHFLHLSQGDICSLDVVLARDKKEAIPSPDTPHCDHVFQPLDNLTVLKITDLCSLTPACTQFFQRLLATRSDHIDTLSLANSDVDFVSSIIHTISCFPALTNLDLDVDAFLLPEFPHMAFPRVQTLALHGDERWLDLDLGETGLVPFSAYPLLSQVSCEEQFLYVFLSEAITPDQRRPIHTIQLRDTVYEVNGCWDYMGGAWSVVSNSLKSLRYSGTPVTHLSFDADGINLAQLASLSEYFTSLETLIISTADDLALERDSNLDQMLENTPQLHSLLISDAPKRTGDKLELTPIARSRTKQREVVDRWSQHCVSLRRIAFTVAMEWVRCAEGWELKDHSDEIEIMPDSDSDSNNLEDSD